MVNTITLREKIQEEINLLESFLQPDDCSGNIGKEWRESNKRLRTQISKYRQMITTLNEFQKQSNEFDKTQW